MKEEGYDSYIKSSFEEVHFEPNAAFYEDLVEKLQDRNSTNSRGIFLGKGFRIIMLLMALFLAYGLGLITNLNSASNDSQNELTWINGEHKLSANDQPETSNIKVETDSSFGVTNQHQGNNLPSNRIQNTGLKSLESSATKSSFISSDPNRITSDAYDSSKSFERARASSIKNLSPSSLPKTGTKNLSEQTIHEFDDYRSTDAKQKAILEIAQLKPGLFSLIPDSIELSENNKLRATNSIDKSVDSKPKLWRFYIGGGLQMSIPSSPKIDIDGIGNVQTSVLYSPLAQLQIKRRLTPKIELGSGLNYSILGQSFSYITEQSNLKSTRIIRTDTVWTWLDTITRVQTITRTTIDTNFFSIDSVAQTGTISYNFFELPLFLSFAVWDNPTWKIHADPGFSVGYLFKNVHSVEPSFDQQIVFVDKKWLFTAMLNVDIERRLSKQLWLKLGFGSNYILNSENTSIEANNRLMLLRTNLGLTYDF